jgi:hypothetical protein
MNLSEMKNEVVGVVSLEWVLKRATNVLTGTFMQVPPLHCDDNSNFKRGEELGGADYVTISVNNVWGGCTTSMVFDDCVGHISSCERIGYHSGSADFMAGVLRSGCPVFVYHAGDDNIIRLYRLHRTLRRDQVELC